MARAGRGTERNAAISALGLEPYVLELELNGYTVVPPSVTGVAPEMIDRLTQLLLDKSEELVGCRFTVEDGPECELDFGGYKGMIERMSRVEPSQFQLMQLCTFDRAFRDLAVNPVAVALMRHMIGRFATRSRILPTFGQPKRAACQAAIRARRRNLSSTSEVGSWSPSQADGAVSC